MTITASTTLGQALNRGTIADGTPAGFTYENLYRDLLIASRPTGFLTLDFSGLDGNTSYQLTLFAWDPGDSLDRDRVWTVTVGTGVSASNTINWGTTDLIDNNSYALNFDITTDENGAFQLTDESVDLQGSAINGFILEGLVEAVPITITGFDYSSSDNMLTLTWNSKAGETYAVKFSDDLIDWGPDLDDGIVGEAGSTTETFDLSGTPQASAEQLFFRVEVVPPPN